jgi:hypothetical protein
VGWYHSIDWYLDEKFGATNCSREELEQAVNGHFAVDFAQVRDDGYERPLPTGKTVQRVAKEFQKNLSIAVGTPLNETFQEYSAYGYDLTVALGLVFHNLQELLKNRGQLSVLHNFTYENDTLVKLINETLTNENFTFQGLTGQVGFYNLIGSNPEQQHAGSNIETYYNRDVNDSRLVFKYSHLNGMPEWAAEIPWTSKRKCTKMLCCEYSTL